jgi:hypothetical protein
MRTPAWPLAALSFASILAFACAPASGDAAAPAAPAAGASAQGTTTGSVTHKGVTMPATHSVAIWSDRLSTLTVYLLPVAPTADDTKALQEGNWRILLGKPGPDPKKWPQAIPYAAVFVRWSDKEAIGQLDKARVDVQVFGIAGAEEHMMLSWMEGEGKNVLSTFTGPVKTGPITLATTKAEADSEATWNVNVTAKVLPSLW